MIAAVTDLGARLTEKLRGAVKSKTFVLTEQRDHVAVHAAMLQSAVEHVQDVSGRGVASELLAARGDLSTAVNAPSPVEPQCDAEVSVVCDRERVLETLRSACDVKGAPVTVVSSVPGCGVERVSDTRAFLHDPLVSCSLLALL